MTSNSFHQIAHTAHGHFVLHFFAAIYWLIHHIRRLEDVGGDELDELFKRYPFLAGYFGEILTYLPEQVTWEDGLRWWEEEIAAWEATGQSHLPLLALAQTQQFTFGNRLALMLIGLVEEDSRFGTVFSQLQAPLTARRPCLELVGQIILDGVSSGTRSPWRICRRLVESGLVTVDNAIAPRSEWILRIPTLLWNGISGDLSHQPAPWCQAKSYAELPTTEALIFPSAFLRQVSILPKLIKSGDVQTVILRGSLGSDRQRVMESVAQMLGLHVLKIDGDALQKTDQLKQIGMLATLTQALPVIRYELGPGETAQIPSWHNYDGPIGLIMGHEGGVDESVPKALTLTVPVLKAELRARCWQAALNGRCIQDLEQISARFHLPGGFIQQAAQLAAAQAALDGRDVIKMVDVQAACRTLNHQSLDTLAARLPVSGSWQQLIVNATTFDKLLALERRCRRREQLLDHLADAFGNNQNRGVRALFSGRSGTGKTLAAKLLAAQLGMDLYRVDLASVVNKYIGETEKNLHRILSRAEELDVVLLLDEGDALLSNRTEVRSSNDRYANLETNYLLQRLEHYEGIVLITSNASENIDTAFQRRMDVVVNFVVPQAEERRQIWEIHLPQNHQISPQLMHEMALRCALTGGQIRNAALQTTLLALENGGVVGDRSLIHALQSEYRKAGALYPLFPQNGSAHGQTDTGAFLAAMSR